MTGRETSPRVSPQGRGPYLPAALIGGGVVILDQATKAWATAALADTPPVTVIENFFHFVYHRNPGGVFGLMAGPPSVLRQVFFITATLLALGFIVWLMRDWGRESAAALTGLSMVGGGAVGNLIDRIIYGSVIDFIDWHWHDRHWPAFNIADSFITVGTLLLLVSALRRPDGGREAADTKAAG